MRNIAMFEDMDFDLIKLSLKSSNVPTMINAYRLISAKTDYPLHLGVTEAGMTADAAVKSALGIGMLLYEGIGDTIRVSVTGSPVQEMSIAYGILRALGIRKTGAEIILLSHLRQMSDRPRGACRKSRPMHWPAGKNTSR